MAENPIDAHLDQGATDRREPRRVVILAFDGATLLDIVSPAEVFDVAAKHVLGGQGRRNDAAIVSANGGPVRGSSGIAVDTISWAEISGPIDTIIVPGGGPPNNPPVPADVVEKLAQIGPHARRICAICTGTFILAAAGLTARRRVTTHWQAADLLAARYPDTIVDADPIFVRDGPIWTSAGFTAGIDVALALIEEDAGHDAAIGLARLLVMFLKRPGGQSQFSVPLATQAGADRSFGELHAWMVENLNGDLSVEVLARRAGMAPRTFARRYVEQLARTPARTVSAFRLDAACRMLTATQCSLKDIAVRVGYKDEQNLRRCFQKNMAVSPLEYRQRFSV